MKNTNFVKPYCPPVLRDNVINLKLSERKDHFAVTIHKKLREQLDISIGDIIIFRLKNHELTRPVRASAAVSLPKKLLRNKKHDDYVNLSVRKIVSRKICLCRPKMPIIGNKLDLRYFIPKKTNHNYPLYVISRDKNTSSVWFPVGGGVKHVTINNLVGIDKIAELLGFYFGDGTKCKSIQSLRLTNCEPSVLIYCLQILEEMGIQRNKCKVQIVYSTPLEITGDIKKRCIKFWSRTLGLNKERIVSVNKAYNVRETKMHGSARVFIDSVVLVQIILHGLLKEVVKKISNPKDNVDYKLLEGFMRGLLAAEGCPELNHHNNLIKIGISFNPHSDELDLYRKLLNNLGISFGKEHGNSLYIYRHENFQKMFEFDAFKIHSSRNEIFINGFLNHPKTKL